MTKNLALPIIVEGVETQAQKDYLMSLGCRYMQGFFFYRPMPPEAFKALIADPTKMDDRGFVFKSNEQFRIREFLNDTIYSDSMLNNIIGPAAIYARRGDAVDIVRYNQQFFEAVDVPDFSQRLESIQRFMPPADAQLILKLLDRAYEDRLNGASGVMAFGRIDGGYSRFLIHFYFLNESGGERRFYGSARDVTELSNLSRHMELLSRYSSRTIIFLERRRGVYSYEVVAHGLEQAMGLSKDRLQASLNDGSFYERVVEEDREPLRRLCMEAVDADRSFASNFRLRTGDGRILSLFMKADSVKDELSDVKSILSIRFSDE